MYIFDFVLEDTFQFLLFKWIDNVDVSLLKNKKNKFEKNYIKKSQ
jgi:hypothetical protein